MDQIIRRKQMLELVGISRATQWRMERAGLFPVRVKVGKWSVGWHLSEVEEWLKVRERVPTASQKAGSADAHRKIPSSTGNATVDQI